MADDQAPTARTRFIESFDSIRFAEPNAAERHNRIVQAEAELFTSLLYGDRMVVSEAMSFDSGGFLEIAERVLLARERFEQDRRRRLDACSVRNPFELAWRRGEGWGSDRTYRSYREMVAHHIALPPERFQLSAWPEITGSVRARETLARHLHDGTAGTIQNLGQAFLRDVAEAYQGDYAEATRAIGARIGQVRRLHSYFQQSAPAIAKTPPLSIEKFATALAAYCRRPGSADRWGADAPLVDSVPRHVHTLLTAEDDTGKSPLFDARTWFHTQDFAQVASRYKLDPRVLELIAEFVDGAYNRVVSKSIGAGAGTYSTKGSPADPAIRVAEELTAAVSEVLEPPPPRRWVHDVRIHAPGGRDTGAYDGVITRKALWAGFWDIVWTPAWQESIDQLDVARKRVQDPGLSELDRADANARFRDAYEQHTARLGELLQKEFPPNTNMVQPLREGDFGTVFSLMVGKAPVYITGLLLAPGVGWVAENTLGVGGGFVGGLLIDAGIGIVQRFLPNGIRTSVPLSVGTRSVRPLAEFGLAR